MTLRIPPGAEWYTAETMARRELHDVARRVEARVDPAIDAMMRGPERRPAARVDVHTRRDVLGSGLYANPAGGAENPIDDAAVHAKFLANVAGPTNRPAADALLSRLNRLEDEPSMRAVLAAC
jgi:2-methylcitrate dehydratase PrpD